jgi:tRNA modification GTPase
MSAAPTVFAVTTPPGAAAVATIAVIGPRAWSAARESFRPAGTRTLPAEAAPDQFWYGHFGDPPGDAVVLSVQSVQPRLEVEIHCHGGIEVIRLITNKLQRLGLTPVSWQQCLLGSEWGNLEGRALAELAKAPTVRTASILLDQVHGAFRRALESVARTNEAAVLAQLAVHASLGRHLTRPWRVAVAGAPNVGKSSLINAIAGYQRAVVTSVAGTTRDAVTVATAIDGWPVELIDTAGQRRTTDDLEGQGIARGQSAIATADLCLWVVSHDAAPCWPEATIGKCLIVVNKADWPRQWDMVGNPEWVIVSALTGTGVMELCDRVSKELVPDPPTPGAAVPFTPELADHVVSARAADPDTLALLLRSAQPS